MRKCQNDFYHPSEVIKYYGDKCPLCSAMIEIARLKRDLFRLGWDERNKVFSSLGVMCQRADKRPEISSSFRAWEKG